MRSICTLISREHVFTRRGGVEPPSTSVVAGFCSITRARVYPGEVLVVKVLCRGFSIPSLIP